MRRVLVIPMVLAFVLAACGGGGNDGDATPSVARGTTTPSASATATRPEATGAAGSPTSGSGAPSATSQPGGTASPATVATATSRPATNVSTPRPIATATRQGGPTATARSNPTATQASDPTATPTVIVVITPGGDGNVELLNLGFGQVPDSEEVGYGFLVRNNSSSTLDFTEYDIVAYDQSGAPLEDDFGYIDMLLPGETRGIGGSIYVPEGATVGSVQVQITSGDPTTTDFPQPFTVSNVNYFGEEFFPTVTAAISSPYNEAVEDLDINAVLFDDAGNIIGGGYGLVAFVLPGQIAPADAPVASSTPPARVEVYVNASSLTEFASDNNDADGQQPTIVQAGWSMSPDGFDAGYGILVENPNSGLVVHYLRFQVTAYDDAGRIVALDASYIAGLFPNERFGIGGSIYPPEGVVIASMEMQVLASNFIAANISNPLSVSDVAYSDSLFGGAVTGTVTNNHSAELASIETHAIAFNANGDIIGGGWGFADEPAPAGGQTTAEVMISVAETPASVQLYATVGNLLDVLP